MYVDRIGERHLWRDISRRLIISRSVALLTLFLGFAFDMSNIIDVYLMRVKNRRAFDQGHFTRIYL